MVTRKLSRKSVAFFMLGKGRTGLPLSARLCIHMSEEGKINNTTPTSYIQSLATKKLTGVAKMGSIAFTIVKHCKIPQMIDVMKFYREKARPEILGAKIDTSMC